MKGNPFSINFGILPTQYIDRNLIVEEIVDELTSQSGQSRCYMLTGMRGSGKTVTMTSVEKHIEEYDDWLVLRLNPVRNMLESLAAKLYDSGEFFASFINKSVNLSQFGIGLNLESKAPAADIEAALEMILKEFRKKRGKLLITIDEVSNTEYMREFASSFQIMIRQELPVYLLMAGLYENIHDLENEKNLSFLYRTPRYEMEPLNLTLVCDGYKRALKVSHDEAMEMAMTTKGYAFAYQVLGKYLWENKEHKLDETVLLKFDEALAHYVYRKIWSELSEKDKWYMSFIVQKESMPVSEILELTKQKKNEFSQYRARLGNKGLIDTANRGVVRYTLPRFDVFVKNMQLEG